MEHFDKRWENKYLIALTKFRNSKSNEKEKQVNQILNVEDVVLIHEENTSIMNFKLDIIESFKPSRDGAKRISNVHYVANGKAVHVRRPVNKLYPIEWNDNEIEAGK